MTNYVQSTNFATKDALASGNALKIVKGTEINTEFANIAIAVATKADTASPTFTGTLTAVNEVLTGTLSVAGTTTLSSALNYGGITLSNSVTGTGNMVLSTSPTLTTPNIGTPSAGVLTSCTGLPMTTGVAGTLAVANGGTGVTASTGTTSVVLSASPTFTGTPTLPTGTIATTQTFGNSSTALATTAFVQAAMALLHPIGSIYTAIISTNPGTLFGFGTWTAFGAGRMLISLDSGNVLFDTAEETGGSANATLPSHTHTASITSVTAGTPAGSVSSSFTGTALATHQHKPVDGSAMGLTPGGGGGAGGGDLNSSSGDVNTSAVSAGTPAGSVTSTFTGSALATHSHTVTNSTEGASATNANYPPFIAVYMWKRTA